MKKRYISSILLLIFFGWAMVNFYDFQLQFAEIVRDPEPPWELTINILPMVLTFILGLYIMISIFRRKRNKKGALKKALFLPQTFEEEDEREKEITAKATRTAYLSMWVAAPMLAALLLIYPHIIDKFPYYPMIILLLLPLVQLITYIISWHKNYHI